MTITKLGRIVSRKGETNVSGTANMRYAITPDIQSYVSVSRGFKGGGYNGFSVASAAQLGFEAERATSYEGGVKALLLNRKLNLDVALFYTKLTNLQVSNFDGQNFIVGNAAAATIKGVEFSGDLVVARGFSLGAALSYNDARYDRYPGAPCTAAQNAAAAGNCTQDLAGRTIANAPKWHGTLSADYEHVVTAGGIKLFGRADFAYLGRQYLQTALAPQTLQDGYGLLNLRAGVRGPERRWGIAFTVANLTGTRYLRHAYDYPLFNGAYLAASRRPRTYGIELETRF